MSRISTLPGEPGRGEADPQSGQHGRGQAEEQDIPVRTNLQVG